MVYLANSRGQTANVGSKPGGVSWIGALDVAGNVYEWTSSKYQPYQYNPKDGREAATNFPGDLRVVRGGSWMYDAPIERNSARNSLDPAGTYSDVGVRCVQNY
jgi:formylglycine-generating enzyme required for sulfatase activity